MICHSVNFVVRLLRDAPHNVNKLLLLSKFVLVRFVGDHIKVEILNLCKSAISETESIVCRNACHRCQHQRMEKRDREDEKAGVSSFSHRQGAQLVL